MRCVNYALQGSVNFQEKYVDYQCLMPFAALSFDQHTKSLSKCQILGAERRSIIHIRG